MNHRYTRKDIPTGEPWVEETCINCGAISHRYAHGFRSYYDAQGRQLKKAADCTDNKPKPQRAPATYANKSAVDRVLGPDEPLTPPPAEEPERPIKYKTEVQGPGVGHGGPPYGKGIFKPHEPLKSIAPVGKILNTKAGMNEVEARLHDSLMLVKLLYEELVKNNIECKARNMAGRFLYSNGHEEIVNYLDTKTAG